MGKKITQLATITEIADDDLLVGVDISDTSGSAEGTNKKFTKANLLSGLAPLDPQLTGWNPDTETWVYHSVDDPTGYIKIEDKDVSANYSVGYRIMFTNGGNVIKGIITAITYSDPDTIITFLHEIDPTDSQALHLLTNSAITENYTSSHKAPLGFPTDPDKWTVQIKNTTGYSQSNPTQAVWYNLGSISLQVPVGLWRLSYTSCPYCIYGNNTFAMQHTLSTSNSTETDKDFTVQCLGYYRTQMSVYKEKVVLLTSKTTYYLLLLSNTVGVTEIKLISETSPEIIKAICAYL